ncbi:MAG: pilus assembly protein PilM, partial [Planctomycetia bacterium]
DTLILIDIGSDRTDVIATDGESIWLRNLPVGGNHFTRALTKEMKLTFAKAEHLKRNATKAPDPKKLYQAMRPVFQDFVNELQKSINFYSSTHRDHVIKKVVGVGNGFKLPGLQKFLQQNLAYEIEKVDVFRGLDGDEVVKSQAFAENLPSFCVAYGLALQGVKQGRLQTNLLPREIQVQRLIQAKKPWGLAAASFLLVGFTGIYIGNWAFLKSINAEAFAAPQKAAGDATQEFGKLAGEYNTAVSGLETAKTTGTTLLGVDDAERRMDWISVLRTINSALPRSQGDISKMDLEKVEEVNVEYVNAVYLKNLGDWYGTLDETMKGTLVKEDRDKGPEGDGWIFQVLGYTFNERQTQFVLDSILSRYQDPEMRKEGLTHALIRYENFDDEWTPAKGSPLKNIPRVNMLTQMAAVNGGGGALSGMSSSMPGMGMSGMGMSGMSGPPGMSMPGMSGPPGMSMPGMGMSGMGAQGGMYGQGGEGMSPDMMQMQMAMPMDMMMYQQVSTEGGMLMPGGGMFMPEEVATLARTDFEIQFVWTKKPAPPPADPAASADGAATPADPAAPAPADPAAPPPADGATSPEAKPAGEMKDEKTEPKSVDAKPEDAKPADAKSADAKPDEAKPTEGKDAEAKDAEAKPAKPKAEDAKPADAKPADAKPEEAK